MWSDVFVGIWCVPGGQVGACGLGRGGMCVCVHVCVCAC